jgi:hypothetical protein
VSTASAGSSDTDADPSLIAFGGDETGIFGEDLL